MIVGFAFLGVTKPTWAAEDTWRVGLEFAWLDPSGDFSTTNVSGTTFGASYDSGFGGGVRGEYQYSARYGVELSVLSAGSVELSSGTFGSSIRVSAFTPLMVGFNVHFTPDLPVDVYAGPLLALIRYSDVDFRAGIGTASTSVSVDNDVGWGAIVGIDVPLWDRGWLAQANLRYIDANIKDSGGAFSFESDFDPLILSVGFGYRF